MIDDDSDRIDRSWRSPACARPGSDDGKSWCDCDLIGNGASELRNGSRGAFEVGRRPLTRIDAVRTNEGNPNRPEENTMKKARLAALPLLLMMLAPVTAYADAWNDVDKPEIGCVDTTATEPTSMIDVPDLAVTYTRIGDVNIDAGVTDDVGLIGATVMQTEQNATMPSASDYRRRPMEIMRTGETADLLRKPQASRQPTTSGRFSGACSPERLGT